MAVSHRRRSCGIGCVEVPDTRVPIFSRHAVRQFVWPARGENLGVGFGSLTFIRGTVAQNEQIVEKGSLVGRGGLGDAGVEDIAFEAAQTGVAQRIVTFDKFVHEDGLECAIEQAVGPVYAVGDVGRFLTEQPAGRADGTPGTGCVRCCCDHGFTIAGAGFCVGAVGKAAVGSGGKGIEGAEAASVGGVELLRESESGIVCQPGDDGAGLA